MALILEYVPTPQITKEKIGNSACITNNKTECKSREIIIMMRKPNVKLGDSELFASIDYDSGTNSEKKVQCC